MIKRIASLLLTIAMLMTGFNVIVSAEETENTSDYANTIEFLQSIGSFSGVDYSESRILTRAEFSVLIAKTLGYNSLYSDEADTLDMSYLNDIGWIYAGDSEADSVNETAFSDVTSDMSEYHSISFAVDLGLMIAPKGVFRPYENVTGKEIARAVSRLLSLNMIKAAQTDDEYVSLAYEYGLMKKVSEKDMSRPLRMADIATVIKNAMLTEPYFEKKNGKTVTYEQRTNWYLMTSLFGVYYEKGTVYANEFAALNGYKQAPAGQMCVKGRNYITTEDTEALLGREVEICYKDDPAYEIVYCAENAKSANSSLIVLPEDIISFENHIFKYYENNSKKTLSVNADTVIVYNGVQLNSYTDEEFDVKSGQIELVKADGASKYNLIKITKYETMYISSVDYAAETAYASSGDMSVLVAKDAGDMDIYLADGSGASFGTIAIGTVLSVARTLDTKQVKRTKVIISTDTVSGKFMSMDKGAKTITVDGNKYEYFTEFVNPEAFEVGYGVMLYQNHEGKIAYAKATAQANVSYGYLKNVGQEIEGDDCFIRMYESDAKFRTYQITDKIRFNGHMVKPDVLYKNLTDASGKTNYQVLSFRVEDGKITEIVTADGMQGAFSKYDISALGVSEVTHRNGGLLSYANNGFAAFLNTTGGYVCFAIPSDRNNEAGYGIVKTFGHETKYTFDELYRKSPDSKFIDVCVQLDVKATTEFDSNAATAYTMISDIKECVDAEGEFYYSLTGVNMSATVEYKVYNEDWFDMCKSMNRGDICRFNLNTVDQKVEYIEKFFDAKSRSMTNGKTVSGDILHPYEALNCWAVEEADSYQFLCSHRYVYADGKPDMAASEAAYADDTQRVYKYPQKIICYDSSRGGNVYEGSKQDIVYSKNPNEASMLLVCSYYENAQVMFVFK